MTTVSRRQIRDANWVRQSFLVRADQIDETDLRNRTFTAARFSFVDTTPGGNIVINPPPQFTRNADPKVDSIFIPKQTAGRVVPSSGPRGIGRYYHEAFDNNKRLISMRFGVPEFNSLTTFFTGFYNSDSGTLARTGRNQGALYHLAKAATFIVPLISWPVLLFSLVGNAWRYLTMKPSSKYYYLGARMPMYWASVQSIVNSIAVNKGVVPRFMDDDTKQKIGDDRYPFTQQDLQRFSALMPDIMSPGGGIDVYAIANKGQRNARRVYKAMEEKYKAAASPADVSNILNQVAVEGLGEDNGGNIKPSYERYMDAWFRSKVAEPKSPSQDSGSSTDANGNPVTPTPSAADMGTETAPQKESDVAGWFEFLEAELDDGSSFVSFRVDAEGPMQESFSNSVGESEIASKFNSMSGESRSTQFNFAGGNIDDGILGKMVGGVMGAAGSVLAGVRDGLQLSGLAALGGSAFADIPKTWQNSTAQLPRMNYSFTLVSPYGNKVSQMFNLYVPLAMILAAALPLSTGKQSYTSPFILELYDRGRAQTRLGMIDSLSISRGTSNLAFTRDGEPLAIEVQFSVVDMSSIVHMPVSQGFSLGNPTAGVFDDDTSFTDYMSVLGSLSLQEQIYTGERLKTALTRLSTEFKSWRSPARLAMLAGDTTVGRIASLFYVGINNR